MEVIARLLPGALLVIAGGLKIYAWAVGPQEGWAAKLILAAAEAALGGWLLTGVRPDWSKRIAAGCFIVFAGWSVALFASGTKSCGCFGPVKAAPHLTFLLDIMMVLLLVAGLRAERDSAHRRKGGSTSRGRKWAATAMALCAILAVIAGVNHPSLPASPGSEIRVGHPWPKAIADVPEDTFRGDWLFLVYDAACHRCLALAEEYAELAHAWKGEADRPRIALITAANHLELEKPLDTADFVQGDLLDPKAYHSAPLLAYVKDGRVMHIRESWTIPDWKQPPYAAWFGNSKVSKR